MFEILISFKMVAVVNLETVMSSNFLILNEKSYRCLLATINHGLYQPSRSILTFYDDFDFYKIFDKFLQK